MQNVSEEEDSPLSGCLMGGSPCQWSMGIHMRRQQEVPDVPPVVLCKACLCYCWTYWQNTQSHADMMPHSLHS